MPKNVFGILILLFLIFNDFYVALTQEQGLDYEFGSKSIQNPLHKSSTSHLAPSETDHQNAHRPGCKKIRSSRKFVICGVKHVEASKKLSDMTEGNLKPLLSASINRQIISSPRESLNSISSGTEKNNYLEDQHSITEETDISNVALTDLEEPTIFSRAMRFKMPRPRLKFGGQSAALERAKHRTKNIGGVKSDRLANTKHHRKAQKPGKLSGSTKDIAKKHTSGKTSQSSKFRPIKNFSYRVRRKDKGHSTTTSKNERSKTIKSSKIISTGSVPHKKKAHLRDSFKNEDSGYNSDSSSSTSLSRQSSSHYDDSNPDNGQKMSPPLFPHFVNDRIINHDSPSNIQEDSLSEKSFSEFETIDGDEFHGHRSNKMTGGNNQDRYDDHPGFPYRGGMYEEGMDMFDTYDDGGGMGGYGRGYGGGLTRAVLNSLPVVTNILSGFKSHDHPGYPQNADHYGRNRYDDTFDDEDEIIDDPDTVNHDNKHDSFSGDGRSRRGGNHFRKGVKNREDMRKAREEEESEEAEEAEEAEEVGVDEENPV